MNEFIVKDSGKREQYDNGFVRDTEEGKPDYTRLILIPGIELIPVEMLERWGAHMLKGAEKYGPNNWRQAQGLAAKLRFARSLFRHAVQLIQGDRTEDHASAILFNTSAYELTQEEETVKPGPDLAWYGEAEPDKEAVWKDQEGDRWHWCANPNGTRGGWYWYENPDHHHYEWKHLHKDLFPMVKEGG